MRPGRNPVIGASRGADLATRNAPSPQRIDIRLGSKHHVLRRHHPRSAPITANGIYSGADLARLAARSPAGEFATIIAGEFAEWIIQRGIGPALKS